MFWDSSDGIEEYTTSVTGFINKCIDDVVPTVNVHTPTRSHGLQATSALRKKGRAATFKERDSNPDAYNKSCYVLRGTIK
jgi:hypothetical protein